MKKDFWEENLFELIHRTSVDLPSDVESAIRRARRVEKRGSHAWWALGEILKNTELARANDSPICQDTGSLVFYFSVPVGADTNALVAKARSAVSRATRAGYLRQNTLDPITGASYETNIAPAAPIFSFQQAARSTMDVRLIMKGGGSENMGCQFSLPDADVKAERDMEGVRRCILEAIWKAQGNACAPTVVGVCIGGDRGPSYLHSKDQFMRKLNDKSSNKTLARLEERIMKDSRALEIGPMGLGGKSTLLGVKIDALSRLPACFFVTVSFMCWAFRRRGFVLGPEGGIHKWMY